MEATKAETKGTAMKAVGWAAMAVVAALAGCSGDDVKDAINDATGQDYAYVYVVDPQAVALPGFCAPAPPVEDLADDLGEWEAIKDHVESVEVTQIEYVIPANDTPRSGAIDLFVADVSDVGSATLVAATQEIAAGTAYPDYLRVNWIGDGRATLNGFVADYLAQTGTPYWVCGLFDPLTAAPDLTIGLKVTIVAHVVPLD